MEKFSINTQKFQLAETASEAATAARSLGELRQHTSIIKAPLSPHNFIVSFVQINVNVVCIELAFSYTY